MSGAPALGPPGSAGGLLRVTVASGNRRVDLLLPGTVPVAELVPELARSVGALEAATVHGGYRLSTPDGRRLAPESGLVLQGVADGAVLVVSAGVDDVVPPLYDDVVEAMADAVQDGLAPWTPAAGRTAALGAAVGLLALGAVALLVQGQASRATAATAAAAAGAGVGAVVSLVGAVVLSRVRREAGSAVTVAWAAAGFAAVAGALAGRLLAPGEPFLQTPAGCAGIGVAVVGVLGLVGLAAGRSLLIGQVVVGVVFGAVGLLAHAGAVSASVALTVVLTLVVLLGGVFPWLALGVTGTASGRTTARTDPAAGPAGRALDDAPVDLLRVADDARAAHEILVGIATAVGALVVLVAPVAVSRGLGGTALSVAACLALMLRTRQHRTAQAVLAGLVGGFVGLATATVAVLVRWPQWRPATALVLGVAGAVVLAATVAPASAGSVRRARLGDVVEGACLLALLPLLVVASGLLDAIAG